jgi:hypothetical protein
MGCNLTLPDTKSVRKKRRVSTLLAAAALPSGAFATLPCDR